MTQETTFANRPRLRCVKCGERERYHHYTRCYQCMLPTWLRASRKRVEWMRGRKGLQRTGRALQKAIDDAAKK